MKEFLKALPNFINQPVSIVNKILIYPKKPQLKGLRIDERDDLMNKAYHDGYGNYVDDLIIKWAKLECFKLAKLKKKKLIVLEIGGGHGFFYDLISDVIDQYINIEPSDLNIKESLNRRLQKKNYFHLKASAEKIPIKDCNVDLIISLASLDHIPNTKKAISEISRVLKVNGNFILSLNNRSSWWKIILRNTKYLKEREKIIKKDHYILWSANELKNNISIHLKTIKIKTLCFTPQIPRYWRYLTFLFENIGTKLFPLGGSNTIAIFKKN